MKKLLTLLLVFIILSLDQAFLQTPSSKAQTSGDWPMFRKDPLHSGFNSEETSLKPPFQLKWAFLATGGPNSPAVADGIVYIEFAGVLFARNTKTGDLIWSKNTPASDHSSVAVAYGMVFDGNGRHPTCTNCGVVAYDAKTGEEKWRINLEPKGAKSPNVDNGVVYFGSDDWYVRAANAYTGEILWTSPRLNEGVVAVPAIADGKVFVGTWGGLLYALDSNNGRIIWQAYTGGVTISSPSVVNNTVYVGSGTQNVYAFNATNGEQKWVYTGGKDSMWGSPAIAYGKLYIQDLVGHLHALDIDNGNLVWEYQTGARPSSSFSSPAVANGVVYVGSEDKKIYAFDAETGDVFWTYETGGPINSSPAVSNGMLYIGSNDGYIYAFGNESISLNVPDIKQYSSPWNNDVYDHANLWSTNPLIERWGCALTSTSMVLKYHGHSSANPDTLNEWLKSQSDGYLRNGLLNWLAVSRYTRLNDSSTSPTLLYRRLAGTQENLINELILNRPPILKEPGHFVVAKSQLPDTFGINDPAYAERTTLEAYGNSFSAIGSYQPTHSNLSYIFLTVDPDITMKVFDPAGNEIQGSFFIDEPLVDDIEGSGTSGEPLAIFLFPEPADGKYKVELSGPAGNYTLDSYLYDKEGDVARSSLDGIISDGQKDKFNISIGEASEIHQEITIDTIIEDLDSAWNQGLIKNRRFYKALRFQLLAAKKFLQTGRNQTAKRILGSVLRQIKATTPILIDPTASQILQNNLQALINLL